MNYILHVTVEILMHLFVFICVGKITWKKYFRRVLNNFSIIEFIHITWNKFFRFGLANFSIGEFSHESEWETKYMAWCKSQKRHQEIGECKCTECFMTKFMNEIADTTKKQGQRIAQLNNCWRCGENNCFGFCQPSNPWHDTYSDYPNYASE